MYFCVLLPCNSATDCAAFAAAAVVLSMQTVDAPVDDTLFTAGDDNSEPIVCDELSGHVWGAHWISTAAYESLEYLHCAVHWAQAFSQGQPASFQELLQVAMRFAPTMTVAQCRPQTAGCSFTMDAARQEYSSPVLLRHSPYRRRFRSGAPPATISPLRNPTIDDLSHCAAIIYRGGPIIGVQYRDRTVSIPGTTLIRLGGIYGDLAATGIANLIFDLTHVAVKGVIVFRANHGIAVVRVNLDDAAQVLAVNGRVWCAADFARCALDNVGLTQLYRDVVDARVAAQANMSAQSRCFPTHLMTCVRWEFR